MRVKFFIIFILFGASSLFSQNDGLFFKPDSGRRVTRHAMGGIFADSNGAVYLYATKEGGGTDLYISENGLDFDSVDINEYPDFRALRLKDGRFAKFNFIRGEPFGVLKMSVSDDGRTFTVLKDTLFIFPDNDSINDALGYHTKFYDKTGGICLVYLAGGVDNARFIHTSPGDPNYIFGDYRTNIFHDSTLGRGYTYVDPYGILLPDGRLRVITMNQHGPPAPPAARKGTIYTFTSYDNGETWQQDPDYRLRYDSFTEFEVYSLNDPKLVRLPDGRFRIYVAALIKEGENDFEYSVISATSYEGPNGVNDEDNHQINDFRLSNGKPNPFSKSGGGTSIEYRLPVNGEVEINVYNLLGQKVRTLVKGNQTAGIHNVYWRGKDDAGETLPSGIYIYTMTTPQFIQSKKIIFMK